MTNQDLPAEDDGPTITITETSESRLGHSIRVAARRTGLSPDTLRMWERRYGFPTPTRDDVNNRLYHEADIERLRLIARALKLGCRVGEVMKLPEAAIRELLEKAPSGLVTTANPHVEIDALLDAAVTSEPDRLERELHRAAVLLGARHFVTAIAEPLTEAIGAAWASGRLAIYQEHLLTFALERELERLSQGLDSPLGPRIIAATLPRETHRLGLAMFSVMASILGAKPQCLGVDLPVAELVRAVEATGPEALAVSVSVCAPPAAVSDQISWLAASLPPTVELWLGGSGALRLAERPARCRVIDSWEQLELALGRLAQGR